MPTRRYTKRFWRKGRQSENVLDRLRKSARYDRNGCFRWQLATSHAGYGWIKIHGVMCHAHRVAWEQANRRPVPQGMQVCHKCDVRDCIRPCHLFIGTCADNHHDRDMKGRAAPQDGENNPCARLTWDAAREIRLVYATSMATHAQLAARYGVERTTILAVIHNETWHDPDFRPIRGHRLH